MDLGGLMQKDSFSYDFYVIAVRAYEIGLEFIPRLQYEEYSRTVTGFLGNGSTAMYIKAIFANYVGTVKSLLDFDVHISILPRASYRSERFPPVESLVEAHSVYEKCESDCDEKCPHREWNIEVERMKCPMRAKQKIWKARMSEFVVQNRENCRVRRTLFST